MHRNDKNERQAKQLEGMLRVYNEERADRENHYRAAKFAAMEDPNAIPLPTGTGYMDPNVAMTPQGMAFPLTMPQRSILKKPLQKSVVHSTPPGPPCSLAPVLSDSEDEDHEDSSRRGRVRFGGKETRVYNDDVSEDNYEPVEVPASIFSGQRAMGVPLPPGLAPPPPRPNFGGPPVSRFSYGVPVGPPQSVISADPEVRGEATISAGPQMRDMRGEATRFVPTTLRVNRQKSKAVPPRLPPKPAASSEGKSTDEAYADFMKEIEGFM